MSDTPLWAEELWRSEHRQARAALSLRVYCPSCGQVRQHDQFTVTVRDVHGIVPAHHHTGFTGPVCLGGSVDLRKDRAP